MEKKKWKKQTSWFWKWFLNNQVVTALLITLLLLIILFLFTKVSYLFEPVWQFLAIVGLPIVLAGVFYYLMNPVVNYLEKRRIKRIYSIIGLFIGVIALIVWGTVVIVPKIQEQTVSFASNLPGYVDTVDEKLNELLRDPLFNQVRAQLESTGDKLMSSLGAMIQGISTSTVKSLGNIVGAVATVVVAVMTMPFILFYLLKDGDKLPTYFVKFLPTKMRKPTLDVLSEMNSQVSSYIRGQLTVALAVAILFMVGFSIVGLEYAVTLGIIAGVLNMIPYLGSFVAMIPVAFLAIVTGPAMIIKVIIVFAIEQTIEGRFVSPLVLGSQLDIHPVTILFVLLTSGKLFGIIGVILGIPIYAASKVIISHIFEWYKEISGLYTEPITDENIRDEKEE
ncbi:MAG: AI-2E family transporter [Enterococcus sp.]